MTLIEDFTPILSNVDTLYLVVKSELIPGSLKVDWIQIIFPMAPKCLYFEEKRKIILTSSSRDLPNDDKKVSDH